MRPVERGNAPGTYTRYQDAQPDLVAVLGDYCSYCERQIETNLAVEHVQPKSRRRALLNEWENFLLGCVHCNSSKGSRHVRLVNYFWPDCDNTARAFRYTAAGEVLPGRYLRSANRARAEASIKLLGLDKIPGHPDRRRRPSRSDQRWLRRQQVYQQAQHERERLQRCDTIDIRELIVEVARHRGLFSIWMQVFADDPDMRDRFINAFRGTSAVCFAGPSLNACKRTGGAL